MAKKRIPWNKGKKMSAEQKKKISDAKKGKKRRQFSQETRKKMSDVRKGIKFSAEHRKKLSEAQKKLHEGKPKLCSIKDCGKKIRGHGYCSSHYYKKRTYGNPLHIVKPKKRGSPSEETRRKIGAANKIASKRFWIKLTKEEKAERIKKPGFFKKGQTPWVKGKKATPETRKKQSRSALHRFQTQKHPHQGTHRSEITKQKLREARLRQKPPKGETWPEKTLAKMLKKQKISFEKQKSFRNPYCIFDFYVEPKVSIFTDGDYWHCNPNDYIYKKKLNSGFKPNDQISGKKYAKDMWARDKKITRELTKKGYAVIRIWQSELETAPEKCLKKILKAIKA